VAAGSVTVLLAVIGLVGCGDASRERPVVRVGDVSINRATVNHWAKAIALGGGAGGALGGGAGSPRRRALRFLISAQWMIGEARDRGHGVPREEVERRVRERIEALPNGGSEYERELSATGQTSDDVELEIEAETAAVILRTLVASDAGRPTLSEVVTYYTHHQAQFRVPTLRVVDLIEALPTRDGAIALGKRLGPGERFARKALTERVAPETPSEAATRDNGELVRAIFAAPLGKVADPVRFNHHWVLLVARKTVPGRAVPLASVKGEITARLSGERHRRAERDFLEAYRRKWIARTSCRAGFVVWGCSQYRGPAINETNPLAAY
jgi:foldase protein PrsA